MASTPPPGCIASLAFVARFMKTCSICVGSALTVLFFSVRQTLRSISSPISLASIFSTLFMSPLISRGCGFITCFLLNARSP